MTQLEFDFEPDEPNAFKWSDYNTTNFYFTNTNHLAIRNLTPDYNMSFNKSGKEIGKLDFNGSELVFTGEIATSARVFLDYLATIWKTRLEQEYNNGLQDGQNKNSL